MAVVLLLLGFYAVTPVWGAYSKQPFKDTFAAALFSWFMLCVAGIVTEIYEGKELRFSSCLIYSLSGLSVSLYRHNYFYVLVPVTIILLVVFIRKKAGAVKTVSLSAGIVAYLFLRFCMFNLWDVQPTETIEALSIPIQQTARAVKYNGNEMSDIEREDIDGVLTFDTIGTVYDPVISDPVKSTARSDPSAEQWRGYFKTWFKQFFDYPVTYVKATLAGTYGYYAFTRDGYPSGGKGNCGMVIMDGINKDHNAHFDEWFDFNYVDRFQPVRSALEGFYHLWHRMPVLSLTDTIPVYTWFIILAGFFVIVGRKRFFLIPVFAELIALATCIASPVNGSFRYFAPIAASCPVLLGGICMMNESINNQDRMELKSV